MNAVRRRLSLWCGSKVAITKKLLECINAIGAARVPVQVNDDETALAKFNPRHRIGVYLPPLCNLIGVYCGKVAPAFESGPLVELICLRVPLNDSGEYKDPSGGKLKRNGKV
jgi:hypothetical protein